jgi:RNA polymerase sigma factor (sigma-70 family)
VTPPDLYSQHLEVIEYAIDFVCRRHRLRRTDAEDFGSVVSIHLLENDSAVLRAFRARSSIQTYLIAVVSHRFQDWRNARWGKWRPSAEARRLGPVAVLLETKLVRDQLSMDEAAETLRIDYKVTESRPMLDRMAARFPPRQGKTFVGDNALDRQAAPDGGADTGLDAERAAYAARKVAALMALERTRLAPRDRVILRLHFDDGLTLADISRLLNLNQKALYHRVQDVLDGLLDALAAGDCTRDEAMEILKHRGFDLIEAMAPEESADVRLIDQGRTVAVTGEG